MCSHQPAASAGILVATGLIVTHFQQQTRLPWTFVQRQTVAPRSEAPVLRGRVHGAQSQSASEGVTELSTAGCWGITACKGFLLGAIAGGQRLRRQQQRSVAVAEAPVRPNLTRIEERQGLSALAGRWRADDGEALQSLALTAALYITALAALHVSGAHWLSVLFMAACLIRCFIVFHDLAHNAFFEQSEPNRIVASVFQFFTNYSLEQWNAVHNPHHAHLGDSTVRDASLTIWFSEEELDEKPWYFSWGHRIIRDPLLFYPLAGLYVFFLNKPVEQTFYRVAVPALIWQTLGLQTAIGYLLSAWLAASIGVGLFHLQHQCNSPYRVEDGSSRSTLDAAIQGSTYLEVPWPLSAFTFGIEYHHIHHFDARVPGYRIAKCHEEGEEQGLWERVNVIDGNRAFKSLFHTQFKGSQKFGDEHGEPQFVSFWPYSAMGLQDV
mmetsp:Transcript_25310/g.45788  ORF Transcript_25310/g.45788 Transcript_25310/m.45788 type:complete len:438 (-) Transcript_25310:74-1387(-)